MGKRSPSPPPAPDPSATAAAQAQFNREGAVATKRLNQDEEVTPWGKTTFEKTGTTYEVPGGPPIEQYRRTIALDPADQARLDKERAIGGSILNLGQGQIGRVSDAVGTPFSMDGLPAAPVANEASRKAMADTLYGRATSRLDPRFDRDRTRLETSLANKGFQVDSDGYSQAMKDFEFAKTDAYSAAAADAEARAGAEQSRMFGLEANSRERALQENLLERGLPLQEMQALLGTAPGIVQPQFSPLPMAGVQPGDVTGPTALGYQGALNAYNQQMGANNATQGGLFGLGSAGIMGSAMYFSDPDVKTDKRRVEHDDVLESVETMPVEEWRYKGDGKRRIGPYADDFAKRFGGDGHTIDVPTMFGVTLSSIKALKDKVDRLERARA